jgi:hypothetical protein
MSAERQQLIDLAKTLLKNSKKEKLDWSESILENRFFLRLKECSVHVAHTVRDMGEAAGDENVYALVIRNSKDRVVDELTSDRDDEETAVLKELFEEARSKARGADDVIKGVMAELQGT